MEQHVFNAKMEGCQCVNSCETSENCVCHQKNKGMNFLIDLPSGIAYNKDGTLADNAPHQIFECNKYCLCDPKKCRNRVVQHGPTLPLQVSLMFTNKFSSLERKNEAGVFLVHKKSQKGHLLLNILEK
jgi:hypothetical protein